MKQEHAEMLAGIDAIIFDMDGTLIDSMWVWSSVDQEFYKKYHLTEPEGFHEDMEGKSYREVAQLFLDAFPELPLTLEGIQDEWTRMAFEQYTMRVPLKKGIREFLAQQKRMGRLLGIATSNGRELVDATLEALGIADFFDSVHTACEVEKGKPAPDIYLLVAKDLQVTPERCLVFEDIPMGILAGKNAGMKTCAVEDKFSAGQAERKKALADYYIEDYEEII